MKTTDPNTTRRRGIGAYNEMKRKSYGDMMAASQNVINAYCKEIQTSYTTMVNAGVDMQKCEDELAEKMRIEEENSYLIK